MGILPFRRKKSPDLVQMRDLLEKSQAGDESAREKLIKQYRPFLLSVSSEVSHRYIDASLDEFSVALLAFNEAIDGFDLSKASFLGFAKTVIRRRLIDYFRSQQAKCRDIPWTEFDRVDEENNVTNLAEVASSLQAFSADKEQSERKQEIKEYAAALEKFGLSFFHLTEISPKHRDARASAIEVARLIASDEALLDYVLKKGLLPMKLLEGKVTVSRKTLERQRRYILAMVILLAGDFHRLQSYLQD